MSNTSPRPIGALKKWCLYIFSVLTWVWGVTTVIVFLQEANIYYQQGIAGMVFTFALPYWLCSIAIAFSSKQRALLTEDEEHKKIGQICLSIWSIIAMMLQIGIDVFTYTSKELPQAFSYGGLAGKIAILIACYYFAKMITRKLLMMDGMEPIIRKTCITLLALMACYSIGVTIIMSLRGM